MSTNKIRDLLLGAFPFNPTVGQERAAEVLGRFIESKVQRPILILMGYAGTGKTTLVGSLVKVLPQAKIKTVLLAPTGRAAKVIAGYSGKPAFTIHKKLYRQREVGGSTVFELAQNLHTNTLFIVDEASMIATAGGMAKSAYDFRDLLEDLIEYVYSGKNCKLVFVGDDAQLPPVGEDLSPALKVKHLRSQYFANAGAIVLTEVVRQRDDSGILFNATHLRERMKREVFSFPEFKLEGFPDMMAITGNELQDELESAYGQYGAEGVMLICRSNKRANLFNQQIRARIRWMEEEVWAGDLMMVVRNNYYWLPEDSSAGFIANGEIIEIKKVMGYEEMYGFRFVNVIAYMIDYPDEQDLEVKLMLDTIQTEEPALGQQQMKDLYHKVGEDYIETITDRRKRHEAILKNEYYQALQVKFAYAVTCHKAQGGQWPVVFVDQGYMTEEMIDCI